MPNLTDFLDQVTRWAESQSNCAALALVGSHARGEARPDSDIDLVLLVEKPNKYLEDLSWIHTFALPIRTQIEKWGKVQSVRVWYFDDLEVEFGLAELDWVSSPLDKGTASVISEGCQVLYERDGFLTARIKETGCGSMDDSWIG